MYVKAKNFGLFMGTRRTGLETTDEYAPATLLGTPVQLHYNKNI